MTLLPAWEQFKRARAKWGITPRERFWLLIGGIRLIIVALVDPRVKGQQSRYLLNMGARACGSAVHRAAPDRKKS